MEPFNDGVLPHPIYPPPKGYPHTSILHGATESSEGGILGALGMRSRNPLTTAFYTIPSVHRQKDVPIRALSIAQQSLLKGGHVIMEPFYDGVLRHPICPPPKGRPHTSISHGATEFSEGGVLMVDFLSADFIARFRGRWACDHEALLRRRSTPSHLSTAKRTSPYEHFPWRYRVF
ncbi:hypothetical protein B9Z19DRAFT_718862 [Tuber borchii]|uniref:Uncharacterized protein n=1 Tax=Tuber borchii TaxID=42251 RepID=A0A2T6Z9S3_TUBBO|nr:hypothetical protein B9Z19DRAFT_718862 [Tuber borchii]